MSTYALCFLQSKGRGHESCFILYSSGNNICEELGQFTSRIALFPEIVTFTKATMLGLDCWVWRKCGH
jgi:hypothetical protein